jgi:hypothetical protein
VIFENPNFGFPGQPVPTAIEKVDPKKFTIETMIPRKPPRLPFPKIQINKVQEQLESGEITSEKSEKTINFLKSRYYNQHRRKEGEGDPKFAAAVLELAEGIQRCS